MKNNIIFFFTFILIVILSFHLFAQIDTTTKLEYYKVSQVRVYIIDQSDVFELRKQGLGFEHIKIQGNYFDVLLDSVQIDKLKKTGYPYEIIIDDMTKDYLERTKESREKIKLKKPSQASGFGYGSMGGYYTFNEVVAQLDTMRSLFPSLISAKDSIGSSIKGRTIWVVKISDNPDVDENESQVFYNSLIHAREPAGMMSVIYFMYYLLENYGTDPEVTYLVNNREFYFVPVINPDGYIYNETISTWGGGMWRKNLRDNDTNSIINFYDGVDLARNFSYMWGYDNIGSSPNPAFENYRGAAPFSEPECQAIRDFFYSRDIKIVNNFHAYWNVIFTSWGYNMTLTPDSTIFNSTIDLATQLNGYKNGFYIPDRYLVNGYPCDWIYGEQTTKPKIFSYLTEVGNDNDGFWPIPERIFPLAEENCYPNKVFAWGLGVIDNPPYIKNGALNLSYCRPLIDTLSLSAVEINPDNHTSNVYAQIMNLNDSLLSEIQLNKVDTIFTGTSILNFTEENFYKIRFKQNGIDIPSNLYSYGNNILRFTTAGPLVVDSIFYAHLPAQKRVSIKPYLTNLGNSLPINNVSMKIICEDPWIVNFPGVTTNFPTIQPGATAISNWVVGLNYDSTTFPGYFNLKFEIKSGAYCYWKDSLKFEPVIVGLEEDANEVPTEYLLSQNYPNPFNSTSTIKYSIPKYSRVTLKIFNVLGSDIETLVNEEKPVGTYEVNWNATNLPSGVYFYQLKAGDFTSVKKMILLK